MRRTIDGDVQRWLCRCCGYRFSGFKQNSVPQFKVKKDVVFQPLKKIHSRPDFAQISVGHCDSTAKKTLNDPFFSLCEDVTPHEDHAKSTVGKNINDFASAVVNAKCALGKKAKNLVKVEPLREGPAGATKDAKGKILEYAWWLKKRGRAQLTIETRVRKLIRIQNLACDLFNPDNVKEAIAVQEWKAATKANVVSIYTDFLRCFNMRWEKPIYKPEHEIPFIPTESEIDQLIAGSGRKMAALLQLLKETAIRIGEACKLRWIDIDTQQRIVRVRAEKNSKPRIFHVSEKLLNMLNNLPRKSEIVFPSKPRILSTYFRIMRRRMAKHLSNPRLKETHFHTIRHWKATQLYHQTKDILLVKEFLGHKKLDSTLVYINIEKAIYYDGKPEEFHVKIAQTSEEIKGLLEVGFEYVCKRNGFMFFRKRR